MNKYKLNRNKIVLSGLLSISIIICFLWLNSKSVFLAKEDEKTVQRHSLTKKESKKDVTLKESKVLFLGDSITWLDGNMVNNVGEIIGYQEVFREAGIHVDTYGNSGATCRLHHNDYSEKNHGSLYSDIVSDKKVDFQDVGSVFLFAGTNDVSQGLRLGDPNSLDPTTTLGALNRIILTIKEENAKIEIFLSSPIESSQTNRPEEQLRAVSKGIEEVAEIQGGTFVDIFQNFTITRTNVDTYLYDTLHPNNSGMQVIGEAFLRVYQETQNDG